MRILHAIGSFLPVKGGGPYYVHHLSRHLEKRGHDCVVVTTTEGGHAETDTVPVCRSRSINVTGAPLAPGYPVTLERAIRSFEPDVIHSNYPLPLYPEVAAVAARAHDIPHVVTCHGAFEMSLDSFVGLVGSVYNRSLLRGTLRLADCLLVSNRGILEEIEFYQRYRDKTSVVPIGVDTDWFDPAAVDSDPPYKATDGRRTVMYAGAFRRYKGLGTLIRAVDRLDRDSDVRLVLVGDGPERDRLVDLVDRLNLSDTVQFPGFVTDEELRRAYADADVFILPSPTITESFGMVVLEAMAMATPVVTTRGSGIGRVLREESAGVVVEPDSPERLANGITRLLDNDELYRNQRDAGTELVRDRFSWTEVIDQNISVYRRLTEI
ncbi:glycosyltransferase family 4 protein [Haloarcula sp. GH36]|uniref:glycosyltransferase family 4 protein n=1 Tax=Haloarcula montana TaxID=3111776 RepID=UPI002D768B95|nr:glycosyltransferase family 4 protein [Haloarcula sp. GH36]